MISEICSRISGSLESAFQIPLLIPDGPGAVLLSFLMAAFISSKLGQFAASLIVVCCVIRSMTLGSNVGGRWYRDLKWVRKVSAFSSGVLHRDLSGLRRKVLLDGFKLEIPVLIFEIASQPALLTLECDVLELIVLAICFWLCVSAFSL